MTNESRKDETPRHYSAVSVTRPEHGSGCVTKEWRDVVTVWGDDTAYSGRELVAARAEQSEMTVRIWVRYRKGITTKNRLICTQKGMMP
ncbi:phage head closure protein [Klebsiella pneumoniae]|nr:phage head closure protein [Klebsiella pneumoniae]